MIGLAPGRDADMRRLLARRDSYTKYSASWNRMQLKIDDLVAEGKDRELCSLRERLIKAARAHDQIWVNRLSAQIREHVRRTDPWRYYRGWLRKD